MGKIVIAGNSQDVMFTVHGHVCEGNQVQHSPMKLANVQSTVRIVKPDVLIICLTEVEDVQEDIFDWIDKNCSTTPVLLVVTDEIRRMLAPRCDNARYRGISVPVEEETLITVCGSLLEKAAAPEEHPSSEKELVLLVDDSPVVLQIVKSMIEGKYEVALASSGQMALEAVQKRRPDLILLDYLMPGMDGRETLEAIKRLPGGADIPVLFLTSVSDRERIMSALQCNPAGYLLKPPNQEMLLQTIAETLQ